MSQLSERIVAFRRAQVARLRGNESLIPLIYASLAGAIAGLAAVALTESIHFTHHWVFEEGAEALPFGRWAIVPVLALGGLLTGLVTRYVARGSLGYGVPDVMYSFEHRAGRVPWRGTAATVLAIQSTLGFGGSAGEEGPSIHIGGGSASLAGQWLRVSPEHQRLMLAAAAGGGLSALFNAPLAGSFFAMELVLRRFTLRNFTGVVVACVIANVIFREILGPEESLLSPEYHLESGWEFFLYVGLGLATAAFAAFFVHVLAAIRQTREILPLGLLRPALAMALVGVIGVWYGEILFTGKEQIGEFVTDPENARYLLLLAALKVVATSLTVGGTGGSGGIMVPSLYIGAGVGAAYGLAIQDIAPFPVAPAGAYAVIGMAGLFAGAARAPFTAVMVGIETSQDYGMVIGLMTVAAVSMVVSQMLTRESVYTDELRRIGVDIEREQGPDPFEQIPVQAAMSQSPTIFTPTTTLADAEAQFQRTSADAIPVLDGLQVAGMVSAFDLIRAIGDGADPGASITTVMAQPAVTIDAAASLRRAAMRMDQNAVRILAVLDEGRGYAGVLTRADMLSAYADIQQRDADTANQLAVMHAIDEPEARFLRVRIDSESPIIGLSLREIRFPEGCLVVSVRRRGRTVIPRGNLRLLNGDALVILAEEEAIEALAEQGIADREQTGRSRMASLWGLREG